MTDIVTIPVTFDGTALWNDDASKGFSFTRGMPGEPPMLRGEDDTVSARAGRVPYPRIADTLPIGLTGWIQAPPGGLGDYASLRAAVETLRREMMTLFTRTGAPRVLSCTLADGATATINADVVPPVLVREVVPALYYELDVALESVDPDWVITPAGS